MALHERPNAGREARDGGCQRDIDPEDVWKAGYVLTHFHIYLKENYCATSQSKWRFHLKSQVSQSSQHWEKYSNSWISKQESFRDFSPEYFSHRNMVFFCPLQFAAHKGMNNN